MNYINIIFFIIIIVVILLFNSLTKNNKKNMKSGFQNYHTTRWSSDLIKRFNNYQTTMNNNNNQFNLDQLQKQASPEEVEEYLKTGLWYWPDDLKELYIESIWSNPMIKIEPQYALNYAMGLYNQNAVRQLLAWNTKEGEFLLYGGDLGYTKNDIPQIHPDQNKHNTIKCSADSLNMEKTIYNGVSFVKGQCNPCSAFDGDFSCPFRLKTGEDDNSISEPWKQLWNL